MKKWEISKANQKIIDTIGINFDWRKQEDDNLKHWKPHSSIIPEVWILELYLPEGKCFEPGRHCDLSIGNNKVLEDVLSDIQDCTDPNCDWCHDDDEEE